MGAHPITPRLLAAGADLSLILHVEVEAAAGFDAEMSLPDDIPALTELIEKEGVALVLLDPLMSRLDGGLDAHKDPDVRRALEPVVKMAQRTGAAVLGLIHVSKASTTDPLTAIMGSRAFVAVARAVISVMVDPNDPAVRLAGQSKSNNGPTNIPTLTFTVVEARNVAVDDEGAPVNSSRIAWGTSRTESIAETMAEVAETAGAGSIAAEVAKWLKEYLTDQGGSAKRVDILKAGHAAEGYTADQIARGAQKLGVEKSNIPGSMPRQTQWSLPGVTPLDGFLVGSPGTH